MQVGVIASHRREAVEQLVEELLPICEAHLQQHGLPESLKMSPSGVTYALVEYSLRIFDAVPSKALAFDEFGWRNGHFLKERATPLHLHWLRKAHCPEHLLEAYMLQG